MGYIQVNHTILVMQEPQLEFLARKVSAFSSQLEAANTAIRQSMNLGNASFLSALKVIQQDIAYEVDCILKLKAVLASVNKEYSFCEAKLIGTTLDPTTPLEHLSFSNLTPDALSSLPYTSISTILSLSLSDKLDPVINKITDYKSTLSNFQDLSEFSWLFTGNTAFRDIRHELKEMGDNPIFNVAGYLDDSLTLKDAIDAGNLDALEYLADKYMKKGVKLATGASGVTGAIYLDLGLNMGKNYVESMQSFVANPSVSTAFNTVWSVSAGAFLDTGFGLAENTLDFVYGLFGAEFDHADFNQAMDFLGNALQDTAETVVVTAVETTKTIVEGIGSSISAIGESVGNWFSKLF